jgi:hypothetical protein
MTIYFFRAQYLFIYLEQIISQLGELYIEIGYYHFLTTVHTKILSNKIQL